MPAPDNRDRRNFDRILGQDRLDILGRAHLDSPAPDTLDCNWDRSSGRSSGQADPGHVRMLRPSDPNRAKPKTLHFAFQPPSNPIRASYQSATYPKASSLPMLGVRSPMFSCD